MIRFNCCCKKFYPVVITTVIIKCHHLYMRLIKKHTNFKLPKQCFRFWYENPGVFSPAQLNELKQANLARVICDNSDAIKQVQQDVFVMAKYPQGFHQCDGEDIPRLDLKVWTHCCEGKSLWGGGALSIALPVYHLSDKFHGFWVCFLHPTHVNARNAFRVSIHTYCVNKSIYFYVSYFN